MTLKQLEVISKLQKEGWTPVYVGGCGICGGAVPVDNPEGKPFSVLPDGSVVEEKDDEEDKV